MCVHALLSVLTFYNSPVRADFLQHVSPDTRSLVRVMNFSGKGSNKEATPHKTANTYAKYTWIITGDKHDFR